MILLSGSLISLELLVLFLVGQGVGVDQEQALELEGITAQDGVSMDRALAFMPEVIIDSNGYQRTKHGNNITVKEKGEKDIYYRIKYDGQLVALGQFKGDDQLHPEIVL